MRWWKKLLLVVLVGVIFAVAEVVMFVETFHNAPMPSWLYPTMLIVSFIVGAAFMVVWLSRMKPYPIDNGNGSHES